MNITDEQIDAIFGESPFIARKCLDKKGYEVVEMTNPDWREVISDDQEVRGNFEGYGDATTFQRRLHVRWVLKGGA